MKSQSREDVRRERRAAFGVIAAPDVFTDVVQQRRHVEHAGMRDVSRERRRERMRNGELPARQGSQKSTAATECTSTVYT